MPNLQIPYIILTVKEFKISRDFYKAVFVDTLGCEVKFDIENFFYIILNDKDQSFGISPENVQFKDQKFNQGRVGLHQFAIELETKKEIEKVYQKIVELGYGNEGKPQNMPDFGDNYYAFYYLDPDGIKHEFVTFEK
jgi:catechol 2,3-dioxygenase-like lactoylglutathione lyase family enzyme